MVVPFVNITCTWGNGEIMMEKALIYSLIGLFWVCTWFTGCSTKLEGMLTVVEIKKVMPEFDTENETEEVEKIEKSQEGELSDKNNKETKASDSTKSQEDSSSVSETKPTIPTTVAPTTSTPTKSPSTTAPTKAPETQPQTTAHTHAWVPVTSVVHHDATYKTVWVQDSAAWDETVITKAAWDEQVLVQEAWDENVLVQDAYDEPVYGWGQEICNVCGYRFPVGTTGDDIDYHALIDPGCGGGWHSNWEQIGTTHHDAVYQTVHHEATYQTVHHEAETTIVHHDATGHNEQAVEKAAWDETVITSYKCSDCGVTKEK